MFDLTDLIRTVGYLGLFGIIFAESGLLIGVFLPGDSLLFTAGFLASPAATEKVQMELLNLPLVCAGCFVAAVLGDAVGYWSGRRWGRPLFDRPDSRFFKRAHLLKAEAFYLKHGPKTIMIARWLPIVRTFAPILAGVAAMPYRTFAIYNVIGGAVWAIGLPVAGYWLGAAIPNASKYIEIILVVIILLSVTPTLLHVWQDHREEIRAWLRRFLAERAARRTVAPIDTTTKPLVRED